MITLFIVIMLIAILMCVVEFITLLFDKGFRTWDAIKRKRERKRLEREGVRYEEDIHLDFIDIGSRPGRDHDHAGSRKQQEDR